MDPPPPADASVNADKDTNNQGEEDEASATEIDDLEDTTLLYQIPKIKKPKRIEKPSPQKIEVHISWRRTRNSNIMDTIWTLIVRCIGARRLQKE